MNDYIKMFIGFDGRLNRQPFWLGIIGLIVGGIVVSFIVMPIFGAGFMSMLGTAMDPNADPQAIMDEAMAMQRNGAWAGLIVWIILAYPALALWLKRAHDRDSNGQLVMALFALTAIASLLQALGLTMTFVDVGGFQIPTMNTVGWILQVVNGLLGLYLLITLGFLKGTEGANQYGADPLAAGGDAS